MADTPEYVIHSVDEYTKAERQRAEALAAAVTLLAGVTPPKGKSRDAHALDVAAKFATYLAGS